MNVLVTGASSGIGAATALAFAERGATVGICARREDRLAEVLADLPGGRSWVVDLADLDGIDAFAARADAELGGIDVLVNNAGIPKRRRTTTMTADDVESVMAINYFSPVRLTLALLPAHDRARPRRHRERVVDGCAPGGVRRRRVRGVEGRARAVHRVAVRGAARHRRARAPRGARHHRHRVQHAAGRQRPAAAARADARPPPRRSRRRSCERRDRRCDQFVSYATARDADTSATKAADPNAFLAEMRERARPASAAASPSRSAGAVRGRRCGRRPCGGG